MKNKILVFTLFFFTIGLFSTEQLLAQNRIEVESQGYMHTQINSEGERVFNNLFYFAINLHGQNILEKGWSLKVALDSPVVNGFGKEIKNKVLEDIELRVNKSSIGEEKEVELRSLFGNGQKIIDKDMTEDYPLKTAPGEWYKRILINFDLIIDIDKDDLRKLASSSTYMLNFTFSLLDSKGNPLGEPIFTQNPIGLQIHENLAPRRDEFTIQVNTHNVTLELNKAEDFNTGVSHVETGGLIVTSSDNKFDLFVHSTNENFIDKDGYSIPVNNVSMEIDGEKKNDGQSQGEQPLSITPTILYKGRKTNKHGVSLDVYYTVPIEKAQALMDKRKGSYSTTVIYTLIVSD